MISSLKARLRKIHFGTMLGILVAGYIAFYLVGTVRHNYELQGQISDLRGQLSNLQNDKDELQYKIQYYQTDAYKEKEARAKLGLQSPGEGVIILPHKDDAAQPTDQQDQKKTAPKKSNWQQWIDFLQGKAESK